MIPWRSLAFRLTAWYTVVLFLGYAGFGAALWITVRAALQAAVDELLIDRLDRLVQTVTTESDGPEDVEDNLIDLLRASPEGHFAQVRGAGGEAVFPLPGMDGAPIPWTGAEPSAGKRTVSIGERSYRIVARDVSLLGRSYRILLASSLESQTLVRERLAGAFMVAAPLSLLLCAFFGFLIARRALRPVEAVADAAAGITSTRLSLRLPVPATGDALERLSRTFNEMLGRLEASFARVDQFSADASHELRTPLSVIRTTAELGLKHGTTEEGFRRDLRDIHSEAQWLGDLIEVLLTLARQDAGAQSIEMSEIDLVAVTASACDPFRARAAGKGLTLQLVAPAEPRVMVGNQTSLRQLVACLLENALTHTDTGGITVSVRDVGEGVDVTVADTGEGIPEEALSRIFDRFYRVDPARTRALGHHGLGLSLARRIAELHQASLSVFSRTGEGSCFTLRLPQRTAAG